MSDINTLLNETTRPTVVRELTELAEKTLSNQSGLTGMAIKSAAAAAKKANPDAISKSTDRVLPEILKELSPYWDAYNSENSAGFGNYLASRDTEVLDSVLRLGDTFSEKAPGAVQKIYSSVRGKVGNIVGPALPELGDIIERHAN